MKSPRYFAPAFRIKVDGSPLDAARAATVSQISVTQELGTSHQFSVTLASPYPTLPWTDGEDAALFKLGTSVSIEMGYVDDVHPLIDAEVTALTPDFPADGTATLRVDGQTRLHRLGRSRCTKAFKDMTDSEIAERIARDQGLTPKCDRTEIKHEVLFQYNETNLDFLLWRAGLIGFEVSVDDKTLLFRKPATGGTKLATLKWGEMLRSFRPSLDGAAPATEVVVRGYDVATAKPIVGRAGPGDEGRDLGRDTAAGTAKNAFGARAEVVVDHNPASQTEAEQIARAIFARRAMEFITGSGETVGMPELRPGALVELAGLGKQFNGRYYINRATHTIGGSAYGTSFAVGRNAAS